MGNRPVFFMHIYLRHPKNGTKVAIAEAEAVADERNGWVRYIPGEQDAPVNELEAKRRRRPAA